MDGLNSKLPIFLGDALVLSVDPSEYTPFLVDYCLIKVRFS